MRKGVVRLSYQVRHKLDCAATVDSKRLEILGLKIKEVNGLYYLLSKNKNIDQLQGYRAVYQHLSFQICKKQVFS